jgi:hypothetical protein
MKEVGDAEGASLVLKPSDFGIKPANTIAVPYRQGEKVRVRVIGPGWLGANPSRSRGTGREAVTVVGGELDQGADVRVRLLRTKDNILIGRPREAARGGSDHGIEDGCDCGAADRGFCVGGLVPRIEGRQSGRSIRCSSLT